MNTTVPAGQSPKKTKSKTTTPTGDNIDTKNPPPPGKTGVAGVAGVPVGTQVQTGAPQTKYVGSQLETNVPTYSKTQYAADAPYTTVMNLGQQDRANLLAALGSIPNLYAAGQAPTPAYIKAANGDFRPADYTALTQILVQADRTGQDYITTISQFRNNPTMASQYFGQVTPTAKKIATTPADALVADINAKFQDLFEVSADKKMAAAYAKEYNKAELAAGGAGLTQTQRDNIFNKYVEQTALSRFAKAKATPGTEDDSQLEQGALGQVVRQLRGAYADNGMAVSEKQIYQDAISGIRSTTALKNKMESINLHATTQFPALKDWVAKGNTVKQYLDGGGYIDSYAKIYGVPRDQITVDKFKDVFAGAIPLTSKEWEASQWKNPLIKQTQYYQDTRKNDLRAMADAFGINV